MKKNMPDKSAQDAEIQVRIPAGGLLKFILVLFQAGQAYQKTFGANHGRLFEDAVCQCVERWQKENNSEYAEVKWQTDLIQFAAEHEDVVAFYAALHLVEAKLAEDGLHSSDHTARGNNVVRFNYLKPIRAEYKTLYDRSRVARYDAA